MKSYLQEFFLDGLVLHLNSNVDDRRIPQQSFTIRLFILENGDKCPMKGNVIEANKNIWTVFTLGKGAKKKMKKKN